MINKERGIWIVLMCIIAFNVYLFLPQILRSNKKIDRIDKNLEVISTEIAASKEQIASYEEKIKKLEDPFYRETLGREKLQMVKDGEVIYKLAK